MKNSLNGLKSAVVEILWGLLYANLILGGVVISLAIWVSVLSYFIGKIDG